MKITVSIDLGDICTLMKLQNEANFAAESFIVSKTECEDTAIDCSTVGGSGVCMLELPEEIYCQPTDDELAEAAKVDPAVLYYDFSQPNSDEDYYLMPVTRRAISHPTYGSCETFLNVRYTSSENDCATISVAEAAKIMGCAESTIYQAVKLGTFPALTIGKTVRIPKSALKRMLDTGKMNSEVTESHTSLDESSAQKVADIVVAEMLSWLQHLLTEKTKATDHN